MRAFRAHAGMDEWRMNLAIALLYSRDPVERRLIQSWMAPGHPVQRSGYHAAFRAEPRRVDPNWNDQRFSIQDELPNVSHSQTPVSRVSDCPSSVPSCPLSRESFVQKARGARGSLKRGRYQASSVSYLAPQEGERMQHTSRPPKFPRTTHKHAKASCHMAGKSLCKEEKYADRHLQKSKLCSLCNASQVGMNSKYCKYAVSAALSLSTGILMLFCVDVQWSRVAMGCT
jgi:hypothetical protein